MVKKERTRFFGLTLDECIKAFFGGNATVAVVVLALITLFLFREGAGFFTQNRDSLQIYREAGLEYVDIMRQQEEDHTALTRYLFDIRMRAVKALMADQGLTVAEANAKLAGFDRFSDRYSDQIEDIRGLVADLGDTAVAIKQKATVARDRAVERQQYLAAGLPAKAAAVQIDQIDFGTEVKAITGSLPIYKQSLAVFGQNLENTIADLPQLPVLSLQPRLERFRQLTRNYVAGFPDNIKQLEDWDYAEPVPFSEAVTAFILGTEWRTASFWQDWYGVLPLLVGSIMVSGIALLLAVPLGVGSAIYVNQIASVREQRLIKPFIEFISAIPSVVLGFFGIAVLGQALRTLSRWDALSWIPGFPFAERLNALTAGCLLALIAVPTIFTLAEDALNNVPKSFKEASYALGASRLQTIIRIIAPASLSGIVSAVLLGLGRVIGETMVVLLCAGNRIAIPDFTQGIAAFVQPVHTMTGIIAQEMGEVVGGSIHYRALFVVGLLLFFIALLINFLAQKIVRKYRIHVG